jgi:sulfur carrier protein ThiS
MVTVNGQSIDFRSGMMVADALQAAGESIGMMKLVIVNGVLVRFDQLRREPLTDGAQIVVMLLVAGG